MLTAVRGEPTGTRCWRCRRGSGRGALAARHVPARALRLPRVVRGCGAVTQGLASDRARPRVPGHPVSHAGSGWPQAAGHLWTSPTGKARGCRMRLSLVMLVALGMAVVALEAPSCRDRLGHSGFEAEDLCKGRN